MDYFLVDESLIVWRPEGILNKEKVDSYFAFLEEQEATHRRVNRFNDLSLISQVQLQHHDVSVATISRTQTALTSVPTKSCIYAPAEATFGIARMYQQLLTSPVLEVKIFRNYSEAAKWLGYPESVLRAPVDGK